MIPFQYMRCAIASLIVLVVSTSGFEDRSTQKEKDVTELGFLVRGQRQAANTYQWQTHTKGEKSQLYPKHQS